ncbi:MAG: NADH-quinone oxidoreductase subunit L, partial [Burkholderiaceae bacterium]
MSPDLSSDATFSGLRLVLLLAPALILLFAALSIAPSCRDRAWRAAAWACGLVFVAVVASGVLLLATGPVVALGLRADAVGAVVALLVAFVGAVIVRFSRPYLGTERDAPGYVRSLLLTLAAVQIVVVTDHLLMLTLAWAGTSFALHRLLTFFSDRPAALLAAHKKFIVARGADACMLIACVLLYLAFGTLSITQLSTASMAASVLPLSAHIAVLLIVLAVLLKTAQLPLHGWLIQVMEAPTPVSALLHAGVVNLGGFVLIRLYGLVGAVPAAMTLLVLVGTFTAVVAALVMTTRISIKVSLAWSTAAQMGFMLLQCGLGLWSMALLHLVAHSLYKAHAFLSTGRAVQHVLVRRLAPVPAVPSLAALLGAGVVALIALAMTAWALGSQPLAQPALWVMAGVFALAMVPMIRRGGSPWAGWLLPVLAAVVLAVVWSALHAATHGWVAPGALQPALRLWPVVAVAFVGLFVVQAVLLARPQGALSQALYPWCYGGLFLDEAFNRFAFRLLPAPERRQTAAAASGLVQS